MTGRKKRWRPNKEKVKKGEVRGGAVVKHRNPPPPSIQVSVKRRGTSDGPVIHTEKKFQKTES